MSGSQRSVASRCLMMGAAALILLTALIAAPVFTRGSAAPIPFGSPAFAAQWNSIEPNVPNFWGPAYQNVFPEQYQEATGGPTSGQRLVQYFDKARMEQTTANGPVTNGLLTVELMSGNRQFGDTTFVAYPPAAIPIVGDPTNTFPTYASFGSGAFLPKSDQTTGPNGNVYNLDGTITVNSQLAADPGAAFGAYQADPGGKYAHNLPLAFSTYLAALPVPSLPVMGFPLTEAVWVRVTLNGAPTWVLVQPFERRVLSYTPTNPPGFQVEMGNIGQHYYQWRYLTNPGGPAGPATATPIPTATVACTTASVPTIPTTATGKITTTGTATATSTPALAPCPTPDPCATATPLPTSTGTPAIGTSTPTATPFVCTTPTATGPQGVEIINFRQTGLTDTTFSFSFNTNLAATSYIRYGTSSGSYPNAIDIATTRTTLHSATVTGLSPGTPYYFTVRVMSSVNSINRSEDFFVTNYAAIPTDTPVPMDTPVPTTPVPPSGQIPAPGSPPTVAVIVTVNACRGVPPPPSSGQQTAAAKTIAAQPAAMQTAAAQTANAQATALRAMQTAAAAATIARGGTPAPVCP